MLYEHSFDMNTSKRFDTDINTFDNQQILKINSKHASRQHNKRNSTDNPYYYYGFVTHFEMQMDFYMSKIYSQLSLQAVEYYSKICEQIRSLRQFTLTQVQKDTPSLGYILTGGHSIFLQEEGKNVMKM